MTQFEKIQTTAKSKGIIVERVGGSEPYEVYREDDHGSVGICVNLTEVRQEVAAFTK